LEKGEWGYYDLSGVNSCPKSIVAILVMPFGFIAPKHF
jgi:hypothetical protein